MKHFDDIYGAFDQVSLEDLDRLARNISMESTIGGLQQKAGPRAIQFFRSAGAFFSKMRFNPLNISMLTARDLSGYVAAVGFVDASNKNIIVPESFTGQWVPYSAELKAAMVKATKMEETILSFNRTVGEIINDPTRLTALSGISYRGATGTPITDAMKAIGQNYFDPRSNHITRTLGAVIERQSDIGVTIATLNDTLSLDKAHPATKALNAVNRTMTMAETLMGIVQRAAADRGVSNQEALDVALQELVDLTLMIAKEMESYGTLLYRIRQFSEAMKDSLKEIKK